MILLLFLDFNINIFEDPFNYFIFIVILLFYY